MSKIALNLRIDPTLKAALVRLARRDRRSLTSLIEDLIIERAWHAGVLPKGWQPRPDGRLREVDDKLLR